MGYFISKFILITIFTFIIIVVVLIFTRKIESPHETEKIIYKYEVKTLYGDTFVVSHIEDIFYADPIIYTIDVKKNLFQWDNIITLNYCYEINDVKYLNELNEFDIFFKKLSINGIYDNSNIRCYELTPSQPQKPLNKLASKYDIS